MTIKIRLRRLEQKYLPITLDKPLCEHSNNELQALMQSRGLLDKDGKAKPYFDHVTGKLVSELSDSELEQRLRDNGLLE